MYEIKRNKAMRSNSVKIGQDVSIIAYSYQNRTREIKN